MSADPSTKYRQMGSANRVYRFSNFVSYIDFMTQKVGKVDTGRILNEFKLNQSSHKPDDRSITKGGNFEKYKEMSDSTRLNDVYVKKFRKMNDIVQLVKESQCERKSEKPVERFVTKNFSFLSFTYNSAHNQFWLQHISASGLSETIYIPGIVQYSLVDMDVRGQIGQFIILEYNQHKEYKDLMMIYSIDPSFYHQFERKTQLWDIPFRRHDSIQQYLQEGLSRSQYEGFEQMAQNNFDSEHIKHAEHIRDLSTIKKEVSPQKDLASEFEQTLKHIQQSSEDKKKKPIGEENNYVTFNETRVEGENESPLKQYINQQQSSQQLYYEPKNTNMPENIVESFEEQPQDIIHDPSNDQILEKDNKSPVDSQPQEPEKHILSAENMKDILTKGIMCIKYGQNTLFYGDKRLVQVEDTLDNMTWKQNQQSKVLNTLPINTIFKIVMGRKTVNFKRFKTTNKKKNALSFSIVFQQRSVDLQAEKEEEKKRFLEALMQLMEQREIKYSLVEE